MNGKEYGIYAISTDLKGKESEDGRIFRYVSGYLTYGGKPIAQTSGNWLVNPGKYTEGDKKGQDKKPWIAFGEAVTKEELEIMQQDGREPDTYGFFNVSSSLNKKGEVVESAKCVLAKIMGCQIPLGGWINRKTIDGKEVDTMAFRCTDDDIAFWEDKLEEGDEYILDDGTPQDQFDAFVETMAADYDKFQNFINKYFASSRVANADKRRELLEKMRSGSTKTVAKQVQEKPAKKRF